jgi:hypothetical protein
MAKIVVFDLDETLGCFVEFSILWYALEQVIVGIKGRKPGQLDFNKFLDLYPEFIRPGLWDILEMLCEKKKVGLCQKVVIYTNNMGPRSWTLMIKSYLEMKLDYPLFDQAICAYMVNNQRVEKGRTTHEKTLADLRACTNIPHDAEVCFLDDLHHPKMMGPKSKYLHLKPYVFSLPPEEIVGRAMVAPFFKTYPELREIMLQIVRQNHNSGRAKKKTEKDLAEDILIGRKIKEHIEDFCHF